MTRSAAAQSRKVVATTPSVERATARAGYPARAVWRIVVWLTGRAGRPGGDVGQVRTERHARHQCHRLRFAEPADEDLGRGGPVRKQPEASRIGGAPLRL